MNQFKNHSTSPNHFLVFEPSQSLIVRAQDLSRKSANNAKIQSNGAILAHKNFRQEFENLARRDARNATIIPEFNDITEMENWLYNNLNSAKLASELAKLIPSVFNRLYTGKTVGEIDK